MKAYVLEDIGKLEYEDVEVPEIRDNEVIVEVKAVGICGSDIPRVFETGTYTFPTIPGHEFAGRVAFTKEKNSKWTNKRVGIFPLIPCKRCPQCLEKKYEMCRQYDYLGSRSDGGFAEYVKVPVWNLIEIPDSVTYEEAAMLEPTAVALHAIRRIDVKKNSSVVVYGAGTIGLLCAMWLQKFGAKVMIITKHSEQKEFVQKIGFNMVCGTYEQDPIKWVLDNTDGQGAQVALECAGSNDSIENCILSVKSCGKVIVVGNPKEDIQIHKKAYWQILRKQLQVIGTWNSSFDHIETDDWHMTLNSISDKTLLIDRLITHKFPFQNLKQGLVMLKEKREHAVKVMGIR